MLKLTCWRYGEDVNAHFNIEINAAKSVMDLKRAIRDDGPADFHGMSPSNLDLYTMSSTWKEKSELPSRLSSFQLHDYNILNTQSRLSNVLDMSKICVIIINAPNPAPITLNCWVDGQELNRVFPVEILGTQSVANLKEAIKAKKPVDFCNIDADALGLYQVFIPYENFRATLNILALEPNMQLGPLDKIFRKFSTAPDDHLHIIVQAPLPKDHSSKLKSQDQDDVLIAMTQSYILATTITSETLPPSQAAKSREYAKIQSSPQKILDCRVINNVDTIAPPIQLFNPAFAYFSSNAFNSNFNVPSDFVRGVRNLMDQFAVVYASERDRRAHLRPILQTIIGRTLLSTTNIDRTAPDITVQSLCGGLNVYLVIGEEKNEFGDGGSDSSTQAAFSFQRIINQKETSEIRLRSCCPTFLIAHAGPWITIMGGIITSKFIVQRLTDFLWVPIHSTHDDNRCLQMARILYALRESIKLLESWYETLEQLPLFDTSGPAIHRRFYPSPDTFKIGNTLIKFEYQRPLEGNISCVTFLARTLENEPKDIVIKFVTSYGEDAHQYMAELGFAPKLFYCGPINVTPDMPSYGELRMVVMEFVGMSTLYDALRANKVPPGTGAHLRRAINELHGAGYVFGDVRPPNVVVTQEGKWTVKLIDFDWSGQASKVKYPSSISSAIEWPNGVAGLEPIEKEHDLAMLEMHFEGIL